MARHRSHSVAFKRQVAGEFIAGETLHALSKQHDVSRQLIRIWVSKFEAGAFDEDAQAAELKAAIRNRAPPKGCTHHLDRGLQYASEAYRELLAANGLVGSMSRRGNPYDCESIGAARRA